jgi:hypothetical protein
MESPNLLKVSYMTLSSSLRSVSVHSSSFRSFVCSRAGRKDTG